MRMLFLRLELIISSQDTWQKVKKYANVFNYMYFKLITPRWCLLSLLYVLYHNTEDQSRKFIQQTTVLAFNVSQKYFLLVLKNVIPF